MKEVRLNKYVSFIVFVVIFITTFFIPSFSNFNDINKINPSVIAWSKTVKGQASRPSQHNGKYLQIRLLVEDNGVF
ncbi:MAG: hypothetical protein ABI863_03415 [Ginsengibacter sp.]